MTVEESRAALGEIPVITLEFQVITIVATSSLDKPAANGGIGISDITIAGVPGLPMIVCVLLIPQRARGHVAYRQVA